MATITLNRPKEKNVLGTDLVNSLGDNLKRCMSDDSVRCIVLTHAGNTFCAGADLKRGSAGSRYSLVDLFTLIQQGPKVVVAKISGHCMGGGVGLAAACDISVAIKTVQLGFTEVRIGVAPAIISVVCLPKMRRAHAAELMLSGEKVSAEWAAEVGLLNFAVEPSELDGRVTEILHKLVQGGPRAIAATKSLLYTVPFMPQGEAYTWTAKLSAELFQSQEARGGIAAFAKRQPAPWVPIKSKM